MSPVSKGLRLIQGALAPAKHERLIIVVMIVGVLLSGVAFAYKVAEFIFTMSSEEAKGFADVPVVVYFAVAAGWLCLLAWSWLTGQLSGLEHHKDLPLWTEEEP